MVSNKKTSRKATFEGENETSQVPFEITSSAKFGRNLSLSKYQLCAVDHFNEAMNVVSPQNNARP